MKNTFETFKSRPGTATSVAAFRAVADGSGLPLLLCLGRAGSGKTHLIEALAIEIYRRGGFVRVLTAFDIISALKRSMGPGQIPPYEELLRHYMVTPRLLVDDLGSGTKLSEWEWGVWEAIISHRYSRRLLTVITTNLDLEQFPERIQSRFADKEVAVTVLNKATDFRPSKIR